MDLSVQLTWLEEHAKKKGNAYVAVPGDDLRLIIAAARIQPALYASLTDLQLARLNDSLDRCTSICERLKDKFGCVHATREGK